MLRAQLRIETPKVKGKGSRDLNTAAGEVVQAATKAAFGEYSDKLLSDLQYQPPQRQFQRDEWTSPAQEKMYYATGGFGLGIPNVRDGYISNSWKVELASRAEGIRGKLAGGSPYNAAIRAVNDAMYRDMGFGEAYSGTPIAKFVYGSFNARDYLKPMQGFHFNSGYHVAYDITQKYYEQMADAIMVYITVNGPETMLDPIIKRLNR